MSRSDRQPVSGLVQHDLLRFYRKKRCVVTGVDADWHHLDEDAANSTFENLVPLVHPLNVILGGLDRQEDPIIAVPDVLPERLIAKASLHYLDWDVAAAFGCSRLAYFVGRKYGTSPLELAGYSVRSLWFARHRSEQRLFRDVLERELIPMCQVHPLDALTLITVYHECASFLSEFGKPGVAAEVLARLNTLLPTWKQYVKDLPYRYAGLIRREAIIEIGQGGDRDLAIGKLKESEQIAPRNLAALVGAANAKAWDCYLRKDYGGTRDAIGHLRDLALDKMFKGTHVQAFDPMPIAIPLAMAAELVLIEFAARHASGESFTDQTGQRIMAALFGFARRAEFTVPLISPSLAQSEAMKMVLNEFRARGAGDWSRPSLTAETLKAVRQAIKHARVTTQ